MTYGPRNTPPENHPRREAIPWCTTHDFGECHCGHVEVCHCQSHDAVSAGPINTCVISTGGPDHKWWKDT